MGLSKAQHGDAPEDTGKIENVKKSLKHSVTVSLSEAQNEAEPGETGSISKILKISKAFCECELVGAQNGSEPEEIMENINVQKSPRNLPC